MDIASETGTPVMRPMFYDYPEEKACYQLDDQYMFGDDILFAPIVNQGQIERLVYLPNGNWINVNDKKIYSGGGNVQIKAEVNQFIAFVKEGKTVLDIFQ
jgi:alpha-D-xyloside xylohydrolase